MINVGPAQTVSLEISGQNILGRDFQDIGLTIQGQMRINRVRVVGYLPSSIQPPQANLRSVRTPDLYQSINDRTGINLSQLFDLNYFGQVQTQAIQFEVERGSTYSSISFCNIIAESNGSSTHYREQCSPPQYAGEERRVIEIPINARLNSLGKIKIKVTGSMLLDRATLIYLE
jgi:hypothetical protein